MENNYELNKILQDLGMKTNLCICMIILCHQLQKC